MARLQTVTGVTNEQLDNYDPSRYDAVPQVDGTFTLVPVLWWDEKSYADYQGDAAEFDFTNDTVPVFATPAAADHLKKFMDGEVPF